MKGLLSINQMTNKVALETMLKDAEVCPIMDTTFDRNGRTWRVTCVAGTFVIGTAVDAQLDDNGEPSRESDIIRVML
ncbi:MAG: hypothetical protein K0U20_08685 [Proteobacteria bacterium]|nr:hypothetical protein [Pseudomonadota bacterium]